MKPAILIPYFVPWYLYVTATNTMCQLLHEVPDTFVSTAAPCSRAATCCACVFYPGPLFPRCSSCWCRRQMQRCWSRWSRWCCAREGLGCRLRDTAKLPHGSGYRLPWSSSLCRSGHACSLSLSLLSRLFEFEFEFVREYRTDALMQDIPVYLVPCSDWQ